MLATANWGRKKNLNTHLSQRFNTAKIIGGEYIPALMGKANVLEILPLYLSEWNWPFSPERFLSLWLISESEVRTEVISLAQELRSVGYLVGVATNQEQFRAQYLQNEMNFQNFFDQCFISCELGCMKPQAEYFDQVTKKLKVKPEEIIFIDDQQNYLDAASKFGWHSILYTNLDQVKPCLLNLLQL